MQFPAKRYFFASFFVSLTLSFLIVEKDRRREEAMPRRRCFTIRRVRVLCWDCVGTYKLKYAQSLCL